MNNLSVLVLTYSKNSDVLSGFSNCYEKYAQGLPRFKVVSDKSMGYEEEYICPNDSFSTRLIYALQSLGTKYVILLLDDYYITSQIDLSEISKCLECLDKDRKVISAKLVLENGFPKGVHRAPFRYGLSLCAGIWNVQELLSILVPNETAWDIELKGSYRLWRKGFKILFPHQSIIRYPSGGVIHKGMVPSHLVQLVDPSVLNSRQILDRPESRLKRRVKLLIMLLKSIR